MVSVHSNEQSRGTVANGRVRCVCRPPLPSSGVAVRGQRESADLQNWPVGTPRAPSRPHRGVRPIRATLRAPCVPLRLFLRSPPRRSLRHQRCGAACRRRRRTTTFSESLSFPSPLPPPPAAAAFSSSSSCCVLLLLLRRRPLACLLRCRPFVVSVVVVVVVVFALLALVPFSL